MIHIVSFKFLPFLRSLVNLLRSISYNVKEIVECYEKIKEKIKEIDDGLWDLRAMVFALEDKILQVYLFNGEFFNIKKSMVSIADLLSLDEKRLQEKIELMKLTGKEYSDEIIDYGIGMNFNKGFLGYCNIDIGSMTIPYLNLPFIIVPVNTFFKL